MERSRTSRGSPNDPRRAGFEENRFCAPMVASSGGVLRYGDGGEVVREELVEADSENGELSSSGEDMGMVELVEMEMFAGAGAAG